MLLRAGKTYLVLLGITVLMASIIGVFRYSGIFVLKTVTFKPDHFSAVPESLSLSAGQNLFGAPIDQAAENLLGKKKVLRVDFDYRFPEGIDIKINDINPVAMIIDGNGRDVYRLDRCCYLLPCEGETEQFDFPIITGLEKLRPYSEARDWRLRLIVEQLNRLKKDCTDFYLAISSIDMSGGELISVYLDGLPFRIDTYAGSLYTSIINLRIFLFDFNPGLGDVKRLDMTSDGLIIAAG